MVTAVTPVFKGFQAIWISGWKRIGRGSQQEISEFFPHRGSSRIVLGPELHHGVIPYP